MSLVNRKHLIIEIKALREMCFWASSHYWTTRPPDVKTATKVRIKIAYLSQSEWFAFVFNFFHRGAVEIFRSLSAGEVWFYTEPINRFTNFSVWCVEAKHLDSVLEGLRALNDVEVEFVVAATKKGLSVPVPLAAMDLDFFEVGHKC